MELEIWKLYFSHSFRLMSTKRFGKYPGNEDIGYYIFVIWQILKMYGTSKF